jgi:hypothetical protein
MKERKYQDDDTGIIVDMDHEEYYDTIHNNPKKGAGCTAKKGHHDHDDGPGAKRFNDTAADEMPAAAASGIWKIAILALIFWAVGIMQLLRTDSDRQSQIATVRNMICSGFSINTGVFNSFVQMYEMQIDSTKAFQAVVRSQEDIFQARTINATG